ncbi:SDR family oxidoreductase [Prosthecobacter vanneervenii]|uniref:NAD(P)-dependent dehydrogenase (Short-subunit alcohol dehydrogenase family) n=1 Tax=Prosthecobacter vanneervenii TaxID=48466 RepID=A0A7W8DLN0_9BACT|nr:SDR family oxidoreductase [Prosthecobacter vanneervenii]MBB5034337.1 NAD(P)-dependent dehydrogenase (short-subunit alcohol dehydrogenase family) [Prosthecobacter vanneervenii]
MNLSQQVCVITGGAKGIGLATAHALLARGARLALLDLENVVLDHPDALSIRCDVSQAAEVQAALDQVTEQLGPISVWVNNAGLARHRWIPDYTEAEIDLMLAVNLKGTILGSQAALKSMIPHRRGHIINVISTASLRGIPSETVYCAAKWGVRGFTQGLAEEAAPHRIRVTAILPGGVDTAFWDDASQRQAPKQLFLKPEHIADGIIRCLEMDDFCVPRELVLRSLDDSDFTVKPA